MQIHVEAPRVKESAFSMECEVRSLSHIGMDLGHADTNLSN